jgi:PAS domain S-box-containing protein
MRPGDSEKRFATLYNLSPNVVILSRLEDGTICEVNLQFESLLGWTAAEAIGRTGLELGLWTSPDRRRELVARVLTGAPRCSAAGARWQCP